MKGKITKIAGQGQSVVYIYIKCKNKFTEMVPVDHRMFQHMVESQQNHDLIGRTIEYENEQVNFID